MTLNSIARHVLAAGILTAGMLVPATAAQAVPSGCSGAPRNNGYQANCTRGTGEFRAVANCVRINRPEIKSTRYGAWRRVNTVAGISVASCASTEEVRGGSWQVR